MKIFKFFLLLFFVLIAQHGFSQKKSAKQLAREEYKIDTLITQEERWNRQVWFNDQVEKMNMNDNLRDDYNSIIGYHYYKVSRLNDLDQNLSLPEMKEKFDDEIKKLNTEAKGLLNEEQYQIHLESVETFVHSVYRKMDWTEQN
ncbi:hypothetical protein [Mangrovimonas futianensis]|uniref:hypothetical protein n=1 Tax=Mangrovimonas futianensis TaxID=2895523 RepID=UPI001E30FAFF|nr:hypothetical protein [Mangrovimonas futianensis]MCF1421294.1 hypothetical protein [Mangrovimonas futianensis]